MNECKSNNVPIQPKLQLNFRINECFGNLPYMLSSRLHHSFSSSYFTQFQNCYTKEHLKSLLRSFKLTKNISDNCNVEIKGYVHSAIVICNILAN